MARKIKAVDVTTGRPVEVDADAIRPGRIRHDTLPEPLLARVRSIHDAIRDVLTTPLEKFELTFMRDGDPEGEVTLWERIVTAYQDVLHKLPGVDRKTVLRTPLGYSMDATSEADPAHPVVRQIIGIVESE